MLEGTKILVINQTSSYFNEHGTVSYSRQVNGIVVIGVEISGDGGLPHIIEVAASEVIATE